jgi:serine/threonine protein kinase
MKPAKPADTTISMELVNPAPRIDTSRQSTPEVLDGRYRLDSILGAGGMGFVYAATQLATGKQVAIKVMRAREQSYAEQVKAAERFVREAKAAARIQHPNVVDVYDVGGDPLSPYLVMERLRGESLRARIGREPLTWDEATTLLPAVLHALDLAHKAGVVHRDLKPDNLFLVEQADGTRILKILDFGVSRLQSHDDVDISLTRSGAIVGTPVYMPIEQLRGDPDLDGRTDVFAMGVVLYESLCGQRPFPARNAAEYGAQLAATEPAPLSKARPALRGDPEEVVLRALARDRDDRFASMADFRSALLTARAAERSPNPWINRGLTIAALIVGGVLAVLAARYWHASDLLDGPPRGVIAPGSAADRGVASERVLSPPPIQPVPLQALDAPPLPPADAVQPSTKRSTRRRDLNQAPAEVAQPARRRDPSLMEPHEF